MIAETDSIAPLREFVARMTELVDAGSDERTLLAEGRRALASLVADDGWLPEGAAHALPDRYAQYLLYADPRARFSVVSFVWGPGQKTPVHDHTVWGLVGILRGAERCGEYSLRDGRPVADGREHLMRPGQVEAVSPTIGDWHQVSNALDDAASISIHVYGADIGRVRRHCLDERGEVVEFVSGYTPAPLPRL